MDDNLLQVLQYVLEVDYWGWSKTILFYVMLVICAAQTFYPILMIIAMWIRQLGFLAQYFHEIDEKSDQHGGEIIGQVLKAHGVEYIFMLGMKNSSTSPVVRGAEKNAIKVVLTKHEVTAVAAADATSRVTGLPGVAVITSAPGLNHTIAAIKAATKAESAILLIGYASSTILKEQHLEVVNQYKTMKSLVKWYGQVDRVRDIAYELREALRQALHGTPGPVYIEFTLDCLHPFPVVKQELERRGNKGWYINYYIQNLFAAGFDVGREIRPWPIEIPFPQKEQVSKVVKSITKAERPLIVMGDQAALPPIDEAKVANMLTDMAIPCFFQGLMRGALPKTHHLYLKHGLKEALQGADLILLMGVSADFKMPGLKIPSKTQVFLINRNKSTLKANASNFGGSKTTQVHSDSGQFLVEVSEKLGRFAISEGWLEDLRQRNLTGEEEAKTKDSSAVAIDESLSDKKVIFVSDTSSFPTRVSAVLQSRGPWIESSTTPTALAGYAIGCQLGRRDHLVCSLVESSSLSFNLSELSTCVNHSLPIPTITVASTSSSSSVSVTDPSSGAVITNIEAAAEVSGAKGLSATPATIKKSMMEAVKLVSEGSSILIHFRE